jgi:membrane fusion protein (multidrug efflux system)
MNCCLSPVAKSRMPYMNIYSKSVHFILGLPLWLSSHAVIALDTGQLSCLLADFEVDEIITERELAALELKRAERSLEQKIIYSPVDAVVVDMLVAKSEYAGVEPLLVLAVLNPLHAEIVMSASYYGRVKKGMQVEVIPEGIESPAYTGTVRIVDRIIDAASGTFGVQVEIQNPALALPAGLKCTARFSAVE